MLDDYLGGQDAAPPTSHFLDHFLHDAILRVVEEVRVTGPIVRVHAAMARAMARAMAHITLIVIVILDWLISHLNIERLRSVSTGEEKYCIRDFLQFLSPMSY